MSQDFSDPFKNVNIEASMQQQQNQPFNQAITENPFGNMSFTNVEPSETMEMPTAPQTDMIQTQGNVQLSQVMGSEMDDPFANVNINPMMNQQPQQIQQPMMNQQPRMNQMQMPPMNQQPQQNFQSGFNAFNQFQQQQQHQQQNFNTNFRSNNNMNQYHDNGNQQQRKYNIIDIAWLVNPKLYDNTLGTEAPYVVISYNGDFNNLRIGLKVMNGNMPFNTNYLTPNNWFNGTNINLYPENCAQIKYSGQNQIQIIERMFNLNVNWMPNSTIITIGQNNLAVNTTDSNGNQYSYTFIGYQYELLKHCFDFMLNGQAWSLHCRVK